MLKKLGIFFILTLITQSCVPLKKLIYLQEDDSSLLQHEQIQYRFKKGDRIVVNIKTRDKELNELLAPRQSMQNLTGDNIYFSAYEVDKDGHIELPVIGKINVLGKTAVEVKDAVVQKLLSTQFRNPDDIFVSVKPAGIQITVLGEVHGPGTITMLKAEPNILEAIAQSGDINLTGNRTDVIVIREEPDGTKKIFHIDLTKKNALNSPVFYLKNNDIVYVKPLPQKTIGTGTTFISTLSTLMGITSFAISIYLLTKSR